MIRYTFGPLSVTFLSFRGAPWAFASSLRPEYLANSVTLASGAYRRLDGGAYYGSLSFGRFEVCYAWRVAR